MCWALYYPYVTKVVRVPNDVYARAEREAERKDVALGVVIMQWMDKADKYEEMETRQR